MPYIGNTIRAADDYRLIDDISSGFNGNERTFALQVAGSAPVPFPKSPQQVLISVNGVIQEPDPTGASGFNLVGTNIVFSSAPTNGHAFFGIIYATADYLNAGGNFPSGSLGAPSITFIGDENSGLYRKSGGSVGFVSDATEIANFDSNGITISSGNLILGDSSGANDDRIKLGASGDLEIFHNGSHSFITDSGTGDLKLRGSEAIKLEDSSSGKPMITCTKNFGTEIYHQMGSAVATAEKKFETTTTGATVTGNLSVTGETTTTDIFLGDSILHTGDTNTKIRFSANDRVTVETGGSERFRVQDDKVMVSVDLKPDTDSAHDLGTNTNRFANGYFDTLYGDGSNLTGIASTTINNNANNRLITGSGTANTLEGESALTFDGATLDINGGTNDTPLILDTTATAGSHLRFRKDGTNKHFVGCGGGFSLGDVDDLSLRTVDNIIFGVGTSEKARFLSSGKFNVLTSTGGDSLAGIRSKANFGLDGSSINYAHSCYEAQLTHNAGSTAKKGSLLSGWDGTIQGTAIGQNYDGTGYNLSLATNNNTSDRPTERLRVTRTGNVEVIDGDLVIGTSGHGIDFSATSNGGVTTPDELFDDYEQGTWTPAGVNFTVQTIYSAHYTKIGNVVFIQMYVQAATGSGASAVSVSGLPYTVKGSNYYAYAACRIGGSATQGFDKVFQINSGSTNMTIFVADGNINEGMISGQHLIMSGCYHAA